MCVVDVERISSISNFLPRPIIPISKALDYLGCIEISSKFSYKLHSIFKCILFTSTLYKYLLQSIMRPTLNPCVLMFFLYQNHNNS